MKRTKRTKILEPNSEKSSISEKVYTRENIRGYYEENFENMYIILFMIYLKEELYKLLNGFLLKRDIKNISENIYKNYISTILRHLYEIYLMYNNHENIVEFDKEIKKYVLELLHRPDILLLISDS